MPLRAMLLLRVLSVQQLPFGICKCVPYLVRIVLFCKRTCRTSCYTLTARYTGSLSKIKVKRTVDACLEASVVCTDYTYTLKLVAGGDTTAAVNALVVVTEHMLRAVVNIVLVLLALKNVVSSTPSSLHSS